MEVKDDDTVDAARIVEEARRYSGKDRSLLGRLKNIRAQIAFELLEVHWAFLFANFLLSPLPKETGGRLRAAVYRLVGFKIGRGTVVGKGWHVEGFGRPYGRLTIGEGCFIRGPRFELNAPVRIGDRASVSDEVLITTDKHDIGPPTQRMGGIKSSPISIGDGAWIGRRSMILGVNVGAGSIVAANAVVTKDVPPNTLVAGTPARVVRELPTDGHPSEEAREQAAEP